MIGIQVGAVSFVDEGVEEVLDIVAEKAGVNALFLATQSFDRGVQGRQVPGRPWPGHGPDVPDDHSGGSYIAQHPELYRDGVIGTYRAQDVELDGFDVLERVLPAAHARDQSVYAFVLENTHSGLTRAVPRWNRVLQVDAQGRLDSDACLRNPAYVTWWLSLVEDHLRSYPLDGLMFGAERGGPLGNVLGRGGFARAATAYCFCAHCEDAAARRGLDAARARDGYRALEKLVATAGGADPNGDSAFVGFLRLLGRYPEILAWDQFWHDGYRELQAKIYGAAKFLAPAVQVGWHLWHHNSFSPLHRAHTDLTELPGVVDFVKPVLYNDCGGYRLQHHVRALASGVFAGVGEQTLFDLVASVLGYDEDVDVGELDAIGLSADYVAREVKRSVRALSGAVKVYPGLDVNVSSPPEVRQTTPERLSAALTAALDAGADGVILSRKYSEMTHANLEAVGRTLGSRGLR